MTKGLERERERERESVCVCVRMYVEHLNIPDVDFVKSDCLTLRETHGHHHN